MLALARQQNKTRKLTDICEKSGIRQIVWFLWKISCFFIWTEEKADAALSN